MEHAQQSYPEQLLQMPDIGPITFRKVEELLFPGQYYVPPYCEPFEEDPLDGPSKYRPILKRAQNKLRLHDARSAKHSKKA